MRSDVTLETIFQQDIITQMQSHGWQVGSPQGYHREKALYEQDVLDFVQKTQDKEWQKFKSIFPMILNAIF
jgi:type I restriction enzyme R subunit